MQEVVSKFAQEFGDVRAIDSILGFGDLVRNILAYILKLPQCIPDTECQRAIGEDVLLRDMTDGKINPALEIGRACQCT